MPCGTSVPPGTLVQSVTRGLQGGLTHTSSELTPPSGCMSTLHKGTEARRHPAKQERGGHPLQGVCPCAESRSGDAQVRVPCRGVHICTAPGRTWVPSCAQATQLVRVRFVSSCVTCVTCVLTAADALAHPCTVTRGWLSTPASQQARDTGHVGNHYHPGAHGGYKYTSPEPQLDDNGVMTMEIAHPPGDTCPLPENPAGSAALPWRGGQSRLEGSFGSWGGWTKSLTRQTRPW